MTREDDIPRRGVELPHLPPSQSTLSAETMSRCMQLGIRRVYYVGNWRAGAVVEWPTWH